MIPKKIHYCWFGNNPIPCELKKYIKSWKKYCPDYEIIKWDESNFDITCHPFIKKAYDEKAWAFVSDLARLIIIYNEGGIYLDTDVELLRNTDFLLNDHFFIGIQQAGSGINEYCTTGLGFGAEPHNTIVMEMIEQYDNLVYDEKMKNDFICPKLNSRVLEKRGYKPSNDIQHLEGATIYPSEYFDPFCIGDSDNLLSKNTVSIHHYSATWMNGPIRFKRRLINFIGLKTISKIKSMLKRSKKK